MAQKAQKKRALTCYNEQGFEGGEINAHTFEAKFGHDLAAYAQS